MSDTEKKMDEMSRKEYDADTGTYMEDVHMNDHIIGRDGDSDGLVDDVEKLIEEAGVRAEEHNKEQERITKERERQQEREQNQEHKEKNEIEMGL